jgi:hypothetical protein
MNSIETNVEKIALLDFLGCSEIDCLCGGPAFDLGREAADFGITKDELGERTECIANNDFMSGYDQAMKDNGIALIVQDICRHHKDYDVDRSDDESGNSSHCPGSARRP